MSMLYQQIDDNECRSTHINFTNDFHLRRNKSENIYFRTKLEFYVFFESFICSNRFAGKFKSN